MELHQLKELETLLQELKRNRPSKDAIKEMMNRNNLPYSDDYFQQLEAVWNSLNSKAAKKIKPIEV